MSVFTVCYLSFFSFSCSSAPASPAKFYTLTTWNSDKGAEWVICGAIQFINFTLVNNEENALDIKFVSTADWGEEKGAYIKNTVIVGRAPALSSNPGTKVAAVSIVSIT